MVVRMNCRTLATAIAVVALGLMGTAPSSFAEDPIASEVAVSDVSDYIGIWKVSFDVMGNEISLFLNIADVGGKIGATLDSEQQPEPLAISSINRDAETEGLAMSSELVFGGSFKIDINLNVHMEGGVLAGDIADKGGLLSATFEAEKLNQEDVDSVQGRRPDPTEARLTVDGKRIRIAFADLKMGTSDWDLFQEVKDGEIFQFTLSRATKIYTDLDLDFDGVIVKKENVAPDYPGVYSLWLKRVGDGWSLVFNEQSDIWGSRHMAEHDVAEVPLTVTKLEGDPQEKFIISLDKVGDREATLSLTWGTMVWSAKASLGQ